MGEDSYYSFIQETKEDVAAGMRKYVQQKQELDKFLEKLIAPSMRGVPNILDVCCGNGHLIYHLSRCWPEASFLGVDYHDFLIQEACSINFGNPKAEFLCMDYHDLGQKLKKEYDIALNWKTASWLPNYEDLLRQLFAVTRKRLFLSSLFYDGDIDFEIRVRENQKVKGKNLFNYYNIYSYPRFEAFCKELGAKRVQAHDFEMPIDLAPPVSKDVMGTYTVKLETGKRLQISGALLMPWKVVEIDL